MKYLIHVSTHLLFIHTPMHQSTHVYSHPCSLLLTHKLTNISINTIFLLFYSSRYLLASCIYLLNLCPIHPFIHTIVYIVSNNLYFNPFVHLSFHRIIYQSICQSIHLPKYPLIQWLVHYHTILPTYASTYYHKQSSTLVGIYSSNHLPNYQITYASICSKNYLHTRPSNHTLIHPCIQLLLYRSTYSFIVSNIRRTKKISVKI